MLLHKIDIMYTKDHKSRTWCFTPSRSLCGESETPEVGVALDTWAEATDVIDDCAVEERANAVVWFAALALELVIVCDAGPVLKGAFDG